MRNNTLSKIATCAIAIAVLSGCGATEPATPAPHTDTASQKSADAEEQPAPEETEDATPSAAEPDGTRTNPIPLGTPIEGDEWIVTINSVDLDAADLISAENQFNEPAPDGTVYILVNVTAQYVGTDPEGAIPWMTIEYVTVDGNTKKTFDDDVLMTVAPDSFDEFSTLYEGASTSGNKLLAVPADRATEGVLAVTPDMFGQKVSVAVQ